MSKKDRSGKQKAYRDKNKTKRNLKSKPNIDMEKNVIRKATWMADDKFVISGEEYQALTQFANLVAPLVEMSNRILGQAELDDRLKFEYAYSDGTEVESTDVEKFEAERIEKLSKRREEIEKYMKILQEQNEKVKEQMAKATAEQTK